MATREKKTRKLRGHVSHGHGRIGKHRKHASGKGNAGSKTHRRATYIRYHPGYIGKLGMLRYNDHSNFHYSNAMNIEHLFKYVPQDYLNRSDFSENMRPVINLTRLGYTKLLGKGVMTKEVPLIVVCKEFSKRAVDKINQAGGVCLFEDPAKVVAKPAEVEA
ncbi:MAG: 60S ribosomal protein L27A [Marteilia pararefringens]